MTKNPISHEERQVRAASLLREFWGILEKTRKDIFEHDESGLLDVCKDCQDDAWNDALKEIQYKHRLEPLDFYFMGVMGATEQQSPC